MKYTLFVFIWASLYACTDDATKGSLKQAREVHKVNNKYKWDKIEKLYAGVLDSYVRYENKEVVCYSIRGVGLSCKWKTTKSQANR